MAEETDWPQWRGLHRDGVWRGVRLPEKLSRQGVVERWRKPIGGGYSGIAVAGQLVFTLDRQEEPGKGERILCFDRKTGDLLWKREHAADYGDMDHGNGPRSTPAVDGERVYTLGAVGHIHCLKAASGETLWSHDSVKEWKAAVPIWGHAASPLVAGDLAIFLAGARPGGTVLALDKKTGAERWRALDDRPGYSSPILVSLGGAEQLVVWTADSVHGLEVPSGKVLWQAPFKTSNYDVSIISPLAGGNRLLVSGYWDGAQAFEFDGRSSPKLLWKKRVPSCLMATPLSRDGALFVLDKRQGLLGLDWQTGEVLWSDEHQLTPKDANPQLSMVWAKQSAALLNSEGELVIASLSRDGFKELGRAPIIGPTWAHPAFSGQEVFARNDTVIVCARILP